MTEVEATRESYERVREIARTLREPKIGLLQKLAEVIGMEKMEELFQRTLEIEAAGGMFTSNGSRRRTPGGVLFQLTRDIMTPRERRKTFREKKPKIAGSLAPQATPKVSKPQPAALPPPTAQQAVAYMHAAAAVPSSQKGPAIVKTTVIGRPKQIKKMDTCTLVVLGLRQPPALPKGLPPVPDTSGATVVVFIAAKQWAKVEQALKADPADELIIEGYPVNEPQRNLTGVWAQSCTTKGLQRALRAQGGDKPE